MSLGLVVAAAFTRPVEMAAGPVARVLGTPVDATVQRIETTETRFNGAPVHAVHATFSSNRGTGLLVSYTVRPPERTGVVVAAHVVPSLPTLAVIDGMDSSVMPVGLLWAVMPFPVFGAALVLVAVGRGMRWVRMLRRGIEAEGILVSKEETNERINHRTVIKLTVHFRDAAGDTWPAVARSVRTWHLTDEPTERVLYLAHDPRQAVVVDELPQWLVWQQTRWSLPPFEVSLRMGGMLLSLAVATALGLAINFSLA